jgi:hypothetical protein
MKQEKKLLAKKYDRDNQVTLLKDFHRSNLFHDLFKQADSFKYVVFKGNSTEHLRLFEEHKVQKLECVGGQSNRSFEVYLYRLVKFDSPQKFHRDMILLLGYHPLKEFRDHPVDKPFHIDQIITLNGTHCIRIKNSIHGEMIIENELNYDNFTPWNIEFYSL